MACWFRRLSLLAVFQGLLLSSASAAELWTETGTLSRGLAARYGVSESQAQREVERVFEALRHELLSGRRVVVLGFGTFAVQERRPRRKRGVTSLGPAKKHLRCRAADSFVRELNRR